jgi:CHAD domain-containing protein
VRADGTVLAELADDRVHAAAGGPTGLLSEWREAEIELGPAGDERLLARLGARLRAAGAQPSAYESKLARALDIAPPPPAGRSTRALLTYLSEQHRMIVAGDLALRLAPTNPETVHDTRVAARRFRSTLRVFASWFDPVEARHLAEELRWYAGVLGEIRDRDVQQRRLLEELSGLPPELALGPVRARITEQLAGESAHHREILRTELDGGRYAALLARLAEWHAAPPLSGAGRPVPKEAARAERKLLRRLRTAVEHQDDAQMHRARKAGKRARYAAELAAAAGHRGQNQPVVKRMRRLQDALGEFQDSVTSRATLRRLGAAAGTTKGENGFTFGLLHEREAGRGALARADAAAWLSRNG